MVSARAKLIEESSQSGCCVGFPVVYTLLESGRVHLSALELVREHLTEANHGELQRERLANVRRKARAPRDPARATKAHRISRATRREVFARDGVQCTYVSPAGRRCEARAFLELDHVEPRALGGADCAANLRVRCRAHNQLAAEQVFGRERVEQNRHFRQQKCSSELDKVHGALRRLGFGSDAARRALGEVRGQAEGELTVEELLRRAVLVATRAA